MIEITLGNVITIAKHGWKAINRFFPNKYDPYQSYVWHILDEAINEYKIGYCQGVKGRLAFFDARCFHDQYILNHLNFKRDRPFDCKEFLTEFQSIKNHELPRPGEVEEFHRIFCRIARKSEHVDRLAELEKKCYINETVMEIKREVTQMKRDNDIAGQSQTLQKNSNLGIPKDLVWEGHPGFHITTLDELGNWTGKFPVLRPTYAVMEELLSKGRKYGINEQNCQRKLFEIILSPINYNKLLKECDALNDFVLQIVSNPLEIEKLKDANELYRFKCLVNSGYNSKESDFRNLPMFVHGSVTRWRTFVSVFPDSIKFFKSALENDSRVAQEQYMTSTLLLSTAYHTLGGDNSAYVDGLRKFIKKYRETQFSMSSIESKVKLQAMFGLVELTGDNKFVSDYTNFAFPGGPNGLLEFNSDYYRDPKAPIRALQNKMKNPSIQDLTTGSLTEQTAHFIQTGRRLKN